MSAARLPDLRRLAREIRAAIGPGAQPAHPTDAALSGVGGVIFTGPASDPSAHLRNVTVFADGAVDRSPCGTGTAAVVAVLDAMGLLPDDHVFVHESVIGTLHRARVLHRTQVGKVPSVVPEVEGTAWMTGEQTLLLDEDDPLREGFRI